MGRGSTKGNENVYFVARKRAAMYNERLYSREGAAELLGISVSTLADYELGNTKVVPVDKVVLMADLYNAPELKTGYCKHECPICSYLPVATEAKGLEGITLRLMKRLDCDELNRIKKELVDITEDGIIDETEKPELKKILAFLDEVAESISELKIVGEKKLRKLSTPLLVKKENMSHCPGVLPGLLFYCGASP